MSGPLCDVCAKHPARVFDPIGAMWCHVCDGLNLGELAVRWRTTDVAEGMGRAFDKAILPAPDGVSNIAGIPLISAYAEASKAEDMQPDADMVDRPTHYNQGPPCKGCGRPIECLDITEHMNFCLGNAVKYVWRCDLKFDAIEDLRKARTYIDREITRREAEALADNTKG